MNKETIIRNVFIQMGEKGINKSQLTEKSGLNKMTISKLLNGKTDPKPETVKRIAEALGVEMKDLI